MKRRRFSEEQVVQILQEFEEGKSVEDICREYNVVRSTVYLWHFPHLKTMLYPTSLV